MHIHYKKKGKQWWSISGSWYRTAAASTFTGGYAGSSNRRGLYFCFFTFLFFNKRLKSFVPSLPSHSLMPLFLLPAIHLFAPFVTAPA
jgi:hypothetical protein